MFPNKKLVKEYVWFRGQNQSLEKEAPLSAKDAEKVLQREQSEANRDLLLQDLLQECDIGPDYAAQEEQKHKDDAPSSWSRLFQGFVPSNITTNTFGSEMSIDSFESDTSILDSYYPRKDLDSRWDKLFKEKQEQKNKDTWELYFPSDGRETSLDKIFGRWDSQPEPEDPVWSLPQPVFPLYEDKPGREIFLEEKICRPDWPKWPYYIDIQDIIKFKLDAKKYRNIEIKNWYAIDGWNREWQTPTAIRSWWGEEGYFLGMYDSAYWIDIYKSYVVPKHLWDLVITPYRVNEDYDAMRRANPAPRFLTFTCQYIEDRDVDEHVTWNHFRYKDCVEAKNDSFDVRVQVFPGKELATTRQNFADLLLPDQFFQEIGYWSYWKRHFFGIWDDLIIRHFREPAKFGGLYRHIADRLLITFWRWYPKMNVQAAAPFDWLLYTRYIESNPDYDPKRHFLHAYYNDDVRGGEDAQAYRGIQYVYAKRGVGWGGMFWWHPRNYCYEMKRGLVDPGDYLMNKRKPIYDKMVEFSRVRSAKEARPPWRKGAYKDLSFFMDQFQFQVFPFIRSIRVALDVLTRPFTYRDECLSRLDGTLFLISHMSRIMPTKSFESKQAWSDFKAFIDTEAKLLETAMLLLLKDIDPVITMFNRIYNRLLYGKIKLENSINWHWQLPASRNYLIGLHRFQLFQGFHWSTGDYDVYYGSPEYYTLNHARKELDPYNHYYLEQFPYKTSWIAAASAQGDKPPAKETKSETFPGCETPRKPVFVPFDPQERNQRIPYNFYWMKDSNCHIQLPLEDRCVNLKSFEFEGQKKIFEALFKNAVDMINISRDHLTQAPSLFSANKDKDDIHYMSPAGPKGAEDVGFETLKAVMTDPFKAHAFDTVPLTPFEDLMTEFKTVIGNAAWKHDRHLLGPGAFRLTKSMQQLFDLHHEFLCVKPHLHRIKKYLKTNLKLVRGLAKCRNFGDVCKFMVKHGHLLSAPFKSTLVNLKSRNFYVVRFSMPKCDNNYFCERIPPHIPDTFNYIKDYVYTWEFHNDGIHRDYVKFKHRRISKWLRESMLTGKMYFTRIHNFGYTNFDMHEDTILFRTDNDQRNPYYLSQMGERRRKSSCELFYLEDDRPKHHAGYTLGERWVKQEERQGARGHRGQGSLRRGGKEGDQVEVLFHSE